MKEKILQVKHKARKKVINSSKFQLLSRFGYVIRGLMYFLFGMLGLEFSVGLRQNGAGFTEAIIFVQKQMFGQFLLAAIIIGFFSYSLWGLLRAILNFNNDNGKTGLILRAGYIGSSFSYAALGVSTLLFMRGFSIKQDSQTQNEIAGKILYLSYGKLLLFIVGVVWIVAGVGQIFIAFKEKFKKNLNTKGMGGSKETIGIWLGKIGIASRGTIFFLFGAFMIKAAWVLDPSKAVATEKIMEVIKAFTFGPFILAAICIGLVTFGFFSIFQGFYFKFPSE